MRHKPRLIEPSPVTIEKRDLASTVMDSLLREPVKQVARTLVEGLEAQVSWGVSADRGYAAGGQGGPVDKAAGYLVFRTEDLEALGVTLEAGDRVTSIAGVATNVYLKKVTYSGHHRGRAWLHLWDFVDYAPQKVSNG